MSTVPLPAEFSWSTTDATNGATGEGLARKFLSVVNGIPGVRTICDLGCGNGYIAGRLAALGYDVTGVDASRSGIELAKRTYPALRFLNTTIDCQLCSEIGNSFDLVISSDVIEHLYMPSQLLDTAHSLLKPNGHLIIGTPYHGYTKNLVLALTGKMDRHFSVLHDGGHIKFFSVKTLTELVKSRRFTDLTFSFYGRAPLLWKNMICHSRKSD